MKCEEIYRETKFAFLGQAFPRYVVTGTATVFQQKGIWDGRIARYAVRVTWEGNEDVADEYGVQFDGIMPLKTEAGDAVRYCITQIDAAVAMLEKRR